MLTELLWDVLRQKDSFGYRETLVTRCKLEEAHYILLSRLAILNSFRLGNQLVNLLRQVALTQLCALKKPYAQNGHITVFERYGSHIGIQWFLSYGLRVS